MIPIMRWEIMAAGIISVSIPLDLTNYAPARETTAPGRKTDMPVNTKFP